MGNYKLQSVILTVSCRYVLLVCVRVGEVGVTVISLVMLVKGQDWLATALVVAGFYLLLVFGYFCGHYDSAIWSPTKAKQLDRQFAGSHDAAII